MTKIYNGDLYMDDARYEAMVEALVNVQPCPFSGQITRDQIIVALGTVDVWPMHILADVIVAGLEHREKQLELIADGVIGDPARLN